MIESKTYYYLSHFSKLDRRKFREYLSSPYFNSNARYLDLLDTMEKLITSEGKMTLTRESLYDVVYPGDSFSSEKLNKLLSDFLRHLLGFLSVERFRNDELRFEQEHLTELIDRKLDKYISQLFGRFKKQIQKKGDSVDTRGHRFELARLKYVNALQASGRWKDPNYSEVLAALDEYCVAKGMQFLLIGANQDKILNTKTSFPFGNWALERLVDGEIGRDDLSQAFHLGHQLISGNEETEHLDRLLELLESEDCSIERSMAGDFLQLALNHCIRLRNRGDDSYLEKAIEIYDQLIENEQHFEKGMIAYDNYKNYVQLKCISKDLDGARIFADKWADKIIGDRFGEAFDYVHGTIALFQQDYSKAIKHFDLSIRSNGDVFITLDARVSILKACFLDGDIAFFQSHWDSFKSYLNRLAKKKWQISKNRLADYRHYLNLLKALSDAKFGAGKGKERARARLIKMLNENTPGINYGWIKRMTELL